MPKILHSTVRIGFCVESLILTTFLGWNYAGTSVASEEVVEQGQQIYADQCAACHGTELEGQPDWRMPLASARLPAPPHDESGHTWHHPDEVLFRIVKEGTAAFVGGGYKSDMPGFADVLSEAEIRAVLDFIKSTWPQREQSYQDRASQIK